MAAEPEAEELTFQEISHLNERKAQLKQSYNDYLAGHPEIRSILNDFMCATLLEKPDNVFQFAQNHFAGLAPPAIDEGPPLQPILVLTGPVAVGKATIAGRLKKALEAKGMLQEPKMTTCRKKGVDEVGDDFIFMSREEMTADVENGRFLHYETQNGALYGISYEALQEVVDSGKICLLTIPVRAFKTLRDSGRFDYKSVFFRPPSLEELARRMKNKGLNEEQVTNKTSSAEGELAFAKGKDNFDEVMVNAELKTVVSELQQVLVRESWYQSSLQ